MNLALPAHFPPFIQWWRLRVLANLPCNTSTSSADPKWCLMEMLRLLCRITKPRRFLEDIPPAKVKHGVCEKIAKVNFFVWRRWLPARRNLDQPPYYIMYAYIIAKVNIFCFVHTPYISQYLVYIYIITASIVMSDSTMSPISRNLTLSGENPRSGEKPLCLVQSCLGSSVDDWDDWAHEGSGFVFHELLLAWCCCSYHSCSR